MGGVSGHIQEDDRVNIRFSEKPFYLSKEQTAFVLEKLHSLTLDEKIGQLFLPINYIEDEQELRAFVKRFQPGGLMNRPAFAKLNQKRHRVIQDESRIPALIPANIESGGNGAATEGTAFGNPLQVAATGDASYALALGRISGGRGG